MTAAVAPGDLTATLRSIIATVVRQDLPSGDDLMATDVARWDSHATVEIIFTVEDRFGFEMSSAEMESIDGLASLKAVVERHIGASA